MSRTIALCVALALALAGCAAPGPQSRATAAQQAGCRQRADEAYQVRNRGAKYAADAYISGSRDTPFSASGATADTTSELPGRYSRESIYSDCINGIGPPAAGAPPPPP